MMHGWWNALSDLHLLRPHWMLLLPLLLVAIVLWQRQRARRNPWSAQVDAHLLPHLLVNAGGAKARQRGWLPMLVATLFCLAMAGPAWRELPQPQLGREAGLVIVLDLSDGMRAADLTPTRVQRARFEIADLLRQRGDGQTALVAYAGGAFTVAPLTDDATTLEALLGALEPDVMPVPGQRLDRALGEAAALLQGAGFTEGDVLVLGYRATANDVAAAQRLAQQGFRVSVLAVGSEVGAPVPLPQGGFLRDDSGELLLPRLDRDSLERLVSPSSGQVVELRNDEGDTRALLAAIDRDGVQGRLRDEAGTRRYVDEGPFVILLLVPFVLLWLRRLQGVLALPLLFLLLTPAAPAQAVDWAGLWQRPDQRAWKALQDGRYEEARADDAPAAVRGAAAYRAGDPAAAAAEFAQDADPVAAYNRGTALAQAGQLEEALAALDSALAAQPDFDDARHNRDVVKRALEQQKRESSSAESGGEGGAGEPQDGEGEQDGEPKESPDGESGKPGDEQGQQAESEGSGDEAASDEGDAEAGQAGEDQREAMEQALKEAEQQSQDGEAAAAPPIDPAAAEKQQAADQWLRRIPDDPGGLLRRKFALEHRRRLLEEGR